MAYPIPLHPKTKRRETLFSFLSRFAAMNAATVTDFAYDLGFQIKRFLDFEDAALAQLSNAAALESEALQSLVSWTGKPVGDSRTEFRREIFPSKAVRNPVMRGCPVCLRGDALNNTPNPASVMVMRGDWLLREVSICCRHHHPLIPLWESSRPADRFDIAGHLRDLAPRIIAGEFDCPLRAPSAYDLWLDQRLENGEDSSCLAEHDLFVATTICGLLGGVLLRDQLPEATDPSEWQAATQAAGFEVLSQGETAFRTALKERADGTEGSQIAPRRAFGKLYDALSTYLTDSGFDPFRRILRDCILETWPIAAGETVLGEVLPARLLHTPTTAAQEAGLSLPLVERFLIEAGAIPEQDDRPHPQRTFSADKYASLLADIPTLVGSPEMRSAMGASKEQLKSLREDGILLPRATHPSIRAPWRIADGLALVAELEALASLNPSADTAWEGIQTAHMRTGLRVGEIIAAIRSGKLQIGRQDDVPGYRSFKVLRTEIDGLAGDHPHIRRRAETLPKGQLASAFAAAIGIKSRGWYPRLFKAGHADACWVHHPVTGKAVLYVTEAHMAAFHRRFLTLRLMRKEFGLQHYTCIARLTAAGVTPFAPDGQDFGPIYERKDVESVLIAARSRRQHRF